MLTRLPLAITVAAAIAGSACRAAEPAGTGAAEPSTAIVVSPFHRAHFVRCDDGKDHVEYDLLVTNVFDGPVTLTAIDVTDTAGKVLMHIDGDVLAQATQALFGQEPAKIIPASGSVAVEVDLILPPGNIPPLVSHRIAYEFPPDDPSGTVIGSRDVTGPEVMVDTHEAIVIAPPLSGAGWASVNGCCVPNVHRNVRIAAGTRIATPETFAIDWIQVRGDKFFEGDGKANDQYPYFGAEVRSVADGEVIAVHDGMEESKPIEEGKPFLRPPTVVKSEDYGGNYVLLRIGPDVYAFYAHLKTGSIGVRSGDRVKTGAVIGKLGNTGNSTDPHLHFGLLDRPDFLTGDSLPFVFNSYELNGVVISLAANELKIMPKSRPVQSAYPLVYGIATLR
jgi:Peptidase family M23